MQKFLIVTVSILLIAGLVVYGHNRGGTTQEYKTVAIRRGDIATTISATGTLEPEETVDIGAQVAGLIVSFGKDVDGKPIDYRSTVNADMVLANIDDSTYKADVSTAHAQLAQAKTAVLKGQADLVQMQAKARQAENNWNRAKAMGPSDALSQNDYDMYQADYESAKANVTVAETEIAQAKSSVMLADASVSKAERNLDFCTIRSPVKGVIIDRRVNVGQTVVSSLNAPSLFLIAKDLSKLQIWVAVNEADIGRIQPNSPVTFTCDAFPDQVFPGRVGKIRWNATMTQNVVMYTVEVEADNPKMVLLPYLTAKVQFEVQRQTDALIVPNAALRWNPASTTELAPDVRDGLKPANEDAPMQRVSAPSTNSSDAKPVHRERHGVVWVRDGTYVRPVHVTLGTSDGISTAVSTDTLHEGDQIVIGAPNRSADAASRSPFLPQSIRRY